MDANTLTIQPTIYVKVERNTKGYNYEASITNARSVEEAMSMLTEVEAKLKAQYGAKEVKEG